MTTHLFQREMFADDPVKVPGAIPFEVLVSLEVRSDQTTPLNGCDVWVLTFHEIVVRFR